MRHLVDRLVRAVALGENRDDGRRGTSSRRGAGPGVIALTLVALASVLAAPIAAQTAAAQTAAAQSVPQAVRAVPGTEKLLGVACPTATSCLAVGDDFSSSPVQPVIIPLAVGAPGLPIGATAPIQVPPDLALRGIACPGSGLCLAVGAGGTSDHGVVLSLRPDGTALGGATAAIPAGDAGSDFGDVACPTSTTCIAVGSRSWSSGPAEGSVEANQGEVVLLTIDGTGVTPGPPLDIAGVEGLWGIACPTTTTCLGVGTTTATPSSSMRHGVLVGLTLGAAGVAVSQFQPLVGTDNLYDIACPTRTRCYAVADGNALGLMVPLSVDGANATVGTIQPVPDMSGAEGIACPTSAACLVAGGNTVEGVAVPFAASGPGVAFGPVQPIAGTSNLGRVTCPTDTRCLAVGNQVSPTSEPGEGVAALVPLQ
jgi:hypothetical protein